jgi:hypothetical protein
MRGVITYNAKPGTLRLDGGRLSFRETGAEAAEFDVALADIGNVKFPFYNLGSVVRFRCRRNALSPRVPGLGAKVQVVGRADQRRPPRAPLGQAVESGAEERSMSGGGAPISA